MFARCSTWRALGTMSLLCLPTMSVGQTRAQVQCALRDRNADEASVLVKCLPFGRLARIHGVWVTGFEFDRFFENLSSPPKHWNAPMRRTTGLSFPQDGGAAYADPGHGALRAYRMSLLGRKSAVPVGMDGAVIVVEQVLSIRQVALP